MHPTATTPPEPAAAAERTWDMRFTSHPRSVSLARQQVRRVLDTWGYTDDDIATATLIVSELATNAVQHGHVPGRMYEVRLTTSPSTLLIEVSDASPEMPMHSPSTADREHGRGLALVAALTGAGGHLTCRRRHPLGKTVCARFGVTRPLG
jgi:anti-sigma regulatory factor (Ser/Thr protein kinase)